TNADYFPQPKGTLENPTPSDTMQTAEALQQAGSEWRQALVEAGKEWVKRIAKGESPQQVVNSLIESEIKPVLAGSKALGWLYAPEISGGLEELESKVEELRADAVRNDKKVYTDQFDDEDGRNSLGIYVYDKSLVREILRDYGISLAPHEFVKMLARGDIGVDQSRTSRSALLGITSRSRLDSKNNPAEESRQKRSGPSADINSRAQGSSRMAERRGEAETLTEQSTWQAA